MDKKQTIKLLKKIVQILKENNKKFEQTKRKSKRQNIIDTIDHLLGIKIENYIEKTNIKPRTTIFINTTNLDDNIINEIIRIGQQYDLFTVEPNGVNGIALIFKK